MKEHRTVRGRDRKPHLSPDAERLVALALGLANAGSRIEDRYWETRLRLRVDKLLDGGHAQPIHDALDRLHQTDKEAYGALIESVEECAETVDIEIEGQAWQALLVAAPLIAWTRFRIPAGPLSADLTQTIHAHWHAHILAQGTRLRVLPMLYSIDQLPREQVELRRLTRKVAASLVAGSGTRLDYKAMPETADMLADSRFLLAVVAAPAGAPLFRWQEIESNEHIGRVQCLEQWVAQARPNLEPLLPGCGFECLLPDAYHLNMREADRRVRPYSIQAAVHYLTHAMGVEPRAIRASIAAFGNERIDEYRLGLSVGNDDEVAYGIVWPLLGAESETDDPSPLDAIREILRSLGVSEIRIWPDLREPEFCEDCGVPLYPNGKGEAVHAEEPQDVEPESTHFH